jgi:hypothetical protein
LYQDEKLWLQAPRKWNRNNQSSLFKNLFDDFKEKIKWLQDNLQQHRLKHFMGSLLQHHT